MDYTVNPMMVERVPVLVPLATVVDEPVRIEVRGEEVVDPKLETRDSNTIINENTNEDKNIWVTIKFWLEMSLILMVGLAFIGAFILFLVWIYNPQLFGPEQY
jgi:hypothetical protein